MLSGRPLWQLPFLTMLQHCAKAICRGQFEVSRSGLLLVVPMVGRLREKQLLRTQAFPGQRSPVLSPNCEKRGGWCQIATVGKATVTK